MLLTALVPFCTSLTLAELITDGPKERLWAIVQYKVLCHLKNIEQYCLENITPGKDSRFGKYIAESYCVETISSWPRVKICEIYLIVKSHYGKNTIQTKIEDLGNKP